jgi:hypothetical protein
MAVLKIFVIGALLKAMLTPFISLSLKDIIGIRWLYLLLLQKIKLRIFIKNFSAFKLNKLA